MSLIKNILLAILLWIFALVFYLMLGFWMLTGWLRDHGPKFTKPLFIWFAGPAMHKEKS